MKMNPIEGRIKDFDRSSLVVALLCNLTYVLLAPFLLLACRLGPKARFASHLTGRFVAKHFSRLIIASHRGMRFSRNIAIDALPNQYIIVANHLSRMDLIYTVSLFSRPTYIGKVELKRSLLGLATILSGSIFVKREEKDSRKAALNALRAKASEGHALGLFPEGASNKTDGEPMEFKLGAFIIAQEFKLPMALTAIHDYPAWDGKREVGIEVFDVLYPDQFASAEAMRDTAFERIRARLEARRLTVEAAFMQAASGASKATAWALQNSVTH
ncbi:lysophospholipid acyltransferase family protein [Oligoflexus tunisiensis]|uniref:lysophospholipid acyltransferase family protein n=1 Tax=Oligoflexus tunisiensis TaxID=708132 RepID=UPI00114D181A|nr:lysophospholipid acyltransferase family protein [Oligoflexus tunisiensis]